METAATTLPSGIALEELLDWRPDFGVITVCVEIDPADRSKGWLIELRKVLTSAVEAGDDGHDRGRALRPRRNGSSTASRRRSCPRALPDRLLRGG